MTAAADNPLRQALFPLGLAWCGVAALRHLAYDRGLFAAQRLAATVVSVGNLTVGGTGKTPAVAWLCERARAHGRRPGVLARGYGRAAGAARNDEGEMLQRRLPWLLQEQDPDRVAAGARLVGRGVDYVVLDDGFQHRRLRRDLDIVCLDAARPFGNGMCLPAGDLREGRAGLRRAGLVLLTRSEVLATDELAERVARVRELAGRAVPIFATSHAPVDVVARPSGAAAPLASLAGRRVVLLSGIARPASFRRTMQDLGAEVVADIRHADHHRFTDAELAAADRAAAAAGAALVTTEKDDARMPPVGPARLVLRIALRFLDGEPSPAELAL
jgi:tetraacyldisaccharide 4'-kinase